MANDNHNQQKRFRNADQEWSHYLKREREQIHGRKQDSEGQNYRGHLPPPFYNAREENYERVQYPPEARFTPHVNEDRGNYGRGGYYGNTYDQESYNEERERRNEESAGYGDNYRKLGDRRWDNRRGTWEDERSTRPGYTPEEQRLDRMGIHRGKGPRSYRRSDERLKEDLNDRLYDDPFLDATDVEVNVRDGEIILTGTVEDRREKRRAEDIAEAISSVKNVENRLRVRQKEKAVKESTERSHIRESLM
jgi:hypothetical protein